MSLLRGKTNPNGDQPSMKDRLSNNVSTPETAISIIGPGMKIVGNCITDGTVRIEGRVEGSVKAGKAVVVGKDGTVQGNIDTQDAVISGTVEGTINAQSRLELQATCKIEGEIFARRMQLEEGAILNGRVDMGEVKRGPAGTDPKSADAESSKHPHVDRGPAKTPVGAK